MIEDKHKHIIETAMRMFNENGFHNTPTSKIAKESGVAVGTLFNCFPSKQDLIVAIYKKIKSDMKLVAPSKPENDCTKLLLKDLWSAVIKWNIQNVEEYKFSKMFKSSPFMKEFIAEQKDIAKIMFVEKIKESDEISEAVKKDPIFAMNYAYDIISSATNYILENDIKDIDSIIDNAYDLFWNGFSS